MKKSLYSFFIGILLLYSGGCFSQIQGYVYGAKVNQPEADSFYNIELTPALTALIKTDYSDLRITDESGQWVPHLLRPMCKASAARVIERELPVLKNETAGPVSRLILQCRDSNLSSLLLYFTNSVAERFCTLTGSNDLTNWFAINDSILITPTASTQKSISFFEFNFPAVTYTYIRVEIKNNGKEPIQILRASAKKTLDADKHSAECLPRCNPACSIVQKDSAGISYLKIQQQAAYHVTSIALQVSGNHYYNRSAVLYIPDSNNHSFGNPGRQAASIVISNNSSLQFPLSLFNAPVFYLLIKNDDNPPLKIEAVTTYAQPMVLTAYLYRQKHYQLLAGNKGAIAPHYDLQEKDIQHIDSLPAIAVQAFAVMEEAAAVTQKRTGSTPLIWLVIGTATIVLGFFTYRLVMDMNQSKK